jgi:hypothetical protein
MKFDDLDSKSSSHQNDPDIWEVDVPADEAVTERLNELSVQIDALEQRIDANHDARDSDDPAQVANILEDQYSIRTGNLSHDERLSLLEQHTARDITEFEELYTEHLKLLDKQTENLKELSRSGGGAGFIVLNTETEDAREMRAQRRGSENTKDKRFMRLLSILRSSVEFQAFEAALNTFKEAVEDAETNQATIDEYIEAIEQENYDRMKELLAGEGIETEGLTNDEIMEKAIEQLAEKITTQEQLISVMKEKAAIVQEKWEKFLEKHPEAANDPEIKEAFFRPYAEELQKMGELLEKQGKSIDFMEARKELAKDHSWDSGLLENTRGEIKTDQKSEDTYSEHQKREEQTDLVTEEDDLESDLSESAKISYSSTLEDQKTKLDEQEKITNKFNRISGGETISEEKEYAYTSTIQPSTLKMS